MHKRIQHVREDIVPPQTLIQKQQVLQLVAVQRARRGVAPERFDLRRGQGAEADKPAFDEEAGGRGGEDGPLRGGEAVAEARVEGFGVGGDGDWVCRGGVEEGGEEGGEEGDVVGACGG